MVHSRRLLGILWQDASPAPAGKHKAKVGCLACVCDVDQPVCLLLLCRAARMGQRRNEMLLVSQMQPQDTYRDT